MSSVHTESAFPLDVPASGCPPQYGITKRELFAAMAMQGFLSNPQRIGTLKETADASVEMAGMLLAALTDETKVQTNGR